MSAKISSFYPILPLHNTSDSDFYRFMISALFFRRHDENFNLHDKLSLKACLYLLKCIKKGVKPEYTLDKMVANGLKKGGAK